MHFLVINRSEADDFADLCSPSPLLQLSTTLINLRTFGHYSGYSNASFSVCSTPQSQIRGNVSFGSSARQTKEEPPVALTQTNTDESRTRMFVGYVESHLSGCLWTGSLLISPEICGAEKIRGKTLKVSSP